MNKSIIYETYCVQKLSESIEDEHKQYLVQEHLKEINRKFTLLLEENGRINSGNKWYDRSIRETQDISE